MTPSDAVPVRVLLQAGRESSVLHGHPWVFSGAVARVEGDPAPGRVADVLTHDGRWLARGFHHPAAGLAVRLYTREPGRAVDEALLRARLRAAVARRASWIEAERGRTDAWRLVYSEADGLSGLVVDHYAGTAVAQVGAAGLVPFLPALVGELRAAPGVERVRVCADPEAVEREGVDAAAVAAAGDAGGAEPDAVEIRESGFAYRVDVGGGQKTGFFLDQRENRRRVAAYARGRRVLSAFCYTGSFEVHAARAGAAEILGIDRSAGALERARAHHAANGTSCPVEYRKADAGGELRRLRDAARAFDLVVLDPPCFVFNRAQKEKGLRAYKDINLLGLKLLAPGGVLATFSCSGLVSAEDFLMMLRWAALDAGREVRIVEQLHQAPDHPVLATFPESGYLKGLVALVE